MGDAALEDFQFLGIGSLGFRDDDLVDVERGLVEYDFCFGVLGGEVDGFGDEEVDCGKDASVDERADSEGEFEAEVLDDKGCDELAEFDAAHNEKVPD